MISVFIGYDSRENVAFHVAANSIQARASQPVSITPVRQSQLSGLFERSEQKLASTEFSFSRFLVPYLCNYEGWAIFMDCDVLCRGDIAELWNLRDERYAVMCVKHDHQPADKVKFLGETQTLYPKKNWSSVMLINNKRCRALSPERVNEESGLYLHQFKWLESDELIGTLPLAWNFLADYYKKDESAKLVHYTEGGPYFEDYRETDFGDEWFAELKKTGSTSQNDLASLTAYANR